MFYNYYYIIYDHSERDCIMKSKKEEATATVLKEMLHREGVSGSLATVAILGAPDPHTENTEMIDTICRAAMRNLGGNGLALLQDIRLAYGAFIKDKTDEQINWLLTNAPESRGHFKNAQALRDYCNLSKSISSSTLLSATEAALSCIDWGRWSKIHQDVEGDISGNEIKQSLRKMQSDIKTMIGTAGEAPPPIYIGTSPARRGELSVYKQRDQQADAGAVNRVPRGSHEQYVEEHELAALDREISNASFYGEFDYAPETLQAPKRQVFKESGQAEHFKEQGVHMVGHTSNATPGTLATVHGLLKTFGHTPSIKAKGLTDDKAHDMAAMLALVYERQRFHSAFEVVVGLQHWLSRKEVKELNDLNDLQTKADLKPDELDRTRELERKLQYDLSHPIKLYEDGLKLIADAASTGLKADILAIKELMVKTLTPEKLAEFEDLCEQLKGAEPGKTDEDVLISGLDVKPIGPRSGSAVKNDELTQVFRASIAGERHRQNTKEQQVQGHSKGPILGT